MFLYQNAIINIMQWPFSYLFLIIVKNVHYIELNVFTYQIWLCCLDVVVVLHL